METNNLVLHVCISGFTQKANRRHGVFKLSEKLRHNSINCDQDRVWLRPWNTDWQVVAEHVWLLSEDYAETCINIYAYSWGAGWGFVQFARGLQERGLVVNGATLCDPVYRHPNILKRWRSLLKRDSWLAPTIPVPANVLSVETLHQRHNIPQGHKLRLTGDMTRETPPVELDMTHQYMDDAEEWHRRCEARAVLARSHFLGYATPQRTNE